MLGGSPVTSDGEGRGDSQASSVGVASRTAAAPAAVTVEKTGTNRGRCCDLSNERIDDAAIRANLCMCSYYGYCRIHVKGTTMSLTKD